MSKYSLRLLKPLYFILLFVVIIASHAYAQSPPKLPPQKRLAGLLDRYQSGQLPDTSYLHSVDSLAPDLLTDDSLVHELSTYHQIAFSNKDLGKYRMWYFRYLAIFSINKNKYGSAIYYSEKNNEEAIRIGVFEKEGIPHSELFAVAVYDNNKDYSRVIAKYHTLLAQVTKLPAEIASGKVSPEQAFVALGIIKTAVVAFYKTGDTAQGNAGIRLYEKMLEGIDKQAEKYKRYLTHYYFEYHMMCFEGCRSLGKADSAEKFLQTAITEVRSPNYLSKLQADSKVSIYSDAFDFYFEHGRRDSAQHYLDELRGIKDYPIGFAGIEQGILLESDSKLLAASGSFEAAYQSLRKLYQMKDSAFHAVSMDKDNNLYALAEVENARNELIRSEERQRRMERFNYLLFFVFILLAFGGIAGFFIYRSGQRHRLLNLRLGLARNFHDEIGPMLLYANTLAKKEMETNYSARLEELKGQIAYAMEAVRGISHDLKSNELSTVQDLYKDVMALLEKIRASTGMDFTIRINNGSRVLSQLQYTHLRKIADELISNSIKHAGGSMICFQIRVTDRQLLIVYSDNGKGFAADRPVGGIGMQNMQERTNLLNGDFQVRNAWPEGYSIELSIPLL